MHTLSDFFARAFGEVWGALKQARHDFKATPERRYMGRSQITERNT
jgi:hypothetical protein